MKRMWSRNEIKEQVNNQVGSGDVPVVKADEILEKMSGYSFSIGTSTGTTLDVLYAGVVKTGNKITFAISIDITKTSETTDMYPSIGVFTIPQAIYNKIVPSRVGLYDFVDNRVIEAFSSNTTYKACPSYITKSASNTLGFVVGISALTNDTKHHLRYECTILLSENLAPQE